MLPDSMRYVLHAVHRCLQKSVSPKHKCSSAGPETLCWCGYGCDRPCRQPSWCRQSALLSSARPQSSSKFAPQCYEHIAERHVQVSSFHIHPVSHPTVFTATPTALEMILEMSSVAVEAWQLQPHRGLLCSRWNSIELNHTCTFPTKKYTYLVQEHPAFVGRVLNTMHTKSSSSASGHCLYADSWSKHFPTKSPSLICLKPRRTFPARNVTSTNLCFSILAHDFATDAMRSAPSTLTCSGRVIDQTRTTVINEPDTASTCHSLIKFFSCDRDHLVSDLLGHRLSLLPLKRGCPPDLCSQTESGATQSDSPCATSCSARLENTSMVGITTVTRPFRRTSRSGGVAAGLTFCFGFRQFDRCWLLGVSLGTAPQRRANAFVALGQLFTWSTYAKVKTRCAGFPWCWPKSKHKGRIESCTAIGSVGCVACSGTENTCPVCSDTRRWRDQVWHKRLVISTGRKCVAAFCNHPSEFTCVASAVHAAHCTGSRLLQGHAFLHLSRLRSGVCGTWACSLENYSELKYMAKHSSTWLCVTSVGSVAKTTDDRRSIGTDFSSSRWRLACRVSLRALRLWFWRGDRVRISSGADRLDGCKELLLSSHPRPAPSQCSVAAMSSRPKGPGAVQTSSQILPRQSCLALTSWSRVAPTAGGCVFFWLDLCFLPFVWSVWHRTVIITLLLRWLFNDTSQIPCPIFFRTAESRRSTQRRWDSIEGRVPPAGSTKIVTHIHYRRLMVLEEKAFRPGRRAHVFHSSLPDVFHWLRNIMTSSNSGSSLSASDFIAATFIYLIIGPFFNWVKAITQTRGTSAPCEERSGLEDTLALEGDPSEHANSRCQNKSARLGVLVCHQGHRYTHADFFRALCCVHAAGMSQHQHSIFTVASASQKVGTQSSALKNTSF